MKGALPVLAFFTALTLLVALAVYKLLAWVVGGLALGVGG